MGASAQSVEFFWSPLRVESLTVDEYFDVDVRASVAAAAAVVSFFDVTTSWASLIDSSSSSSSS